MSARRAADTPDAIEDAHKMTPGESRGQVLEPIADPDFFAQVAWTTRGGRRVPNGADLDPLGCTGTSSQPRRSHGQGATQASPTGLPRRDMDRLRDEWAYDTRRAHSVGVGGRLRSISLLSGDRDVRVCENGVPPRADGRARAGHGKALLALEGVLQRRRRRASA